MNKILMIKSAFLFVVFCNAFVDVTHKVLLQNIAFKIYSGNEQVIWISIINALIIIPFVLLFSVSGYLSDKYNKKDILIYGGLSSFALSLLMVLAYMSGSFILCMFVLLLLAIQSAIYSPAKFGIIIDIYGKNNLSKGNAAIQTISIISILFSIAVTSLVFENFYESHSLFFITNKDELLSQILPLTYFIVPVGFLEFVVSFLVLKKLDTNFTNQGNLSLNKDDLLKAKLLKENIKIITNDKIIYICVIGLSVFWAISQGMIAVFPSYAKDYLNITNVFTINLVIAASGLGIALGSYIYSKISKYYIELGTVSLGAIMMSVMIFISLKLDSPLLIGICFLGFGVFGGMFIVPLNALIQYNASKKQLGTILAGNNWFNSLAMLLMLCMTTIVAYFNLNSLNTLYLILTIISIGAIYTIVKLPQSLILLFLKTVVGLRYKLEVEGLKNIPNDKGTLLLGNHISWIDWAILLMSVPKEIRFAMDKTIYNKWYLKWMLKIFNVIPISHLGSKQAIKEIAKALDEKQTIVLFPEGSISRTGHLGEFKRGFEVILNICKSDVVVVPFFIRGLWQSLFSRASKKYIDSKTTKNVTIIFGKRIKKEKANIAYVKNEIIKLSSKVWKTHITEQPSLNEVVLKRLKEVKNEIIFADTLGVELSGYKFLSASILFSKLLKKQLLNQNIGVVLPSSSAGAFINYSLLLQGKTAVNLNYTSDTNALISAVKKANISQIITSKKFVDKLQARGLDISVLEEFARFYYLEDLKPQIKKSEAIRVFLTIKFLPCFILKLLYLKKMKKDDIALILFSSGSEGNAKGICLTNDNILGNSEQIAAVLNANHQDIMVGILPLFHAFGVVVNTYLPLIQGIKCVCHADPTDAYGVGKVVQDYKGTIITATSTFYRLYTKNPKLTPNMFETLRIVVAGAEKLNENVRAEFEKKFNKDILQGYGTTETSPVASCNLPDVYTNEGDFQIGCKHTTVGMPLPGTTIKIVDPQTFEELPNNQEGLILISGIQVMRGYLDDEEKTKSVLKRIGDKVYYITGDKGKIDEDGFLTIVDRYSRFAKIGGEMISLGMVEEKLFGLFDSDIEFLATSIEDEKKGEKIVLLVSNIDEVKLQELKQNILTNFENKLMIPNSIKVVDEIPKLGSGKKDYSKAKIIAKDLCA